MSRSRVVCAWVLMAAAACSDPIAGPKGSPGDPRMVSPPSNAPQVVELRGVVEEIPEGFGLRQPTRLVQLRYADSDALMSALGQEVVLVGRFGADGAFDVSSMRLAESDPGEATSRIPAAHGGRVRH